MTLDGIGVKTTNAEVMSRWVPNSERRLRALAQHLWGTCGFRLPKRVQPPHPPSPVEPLLGNA
jgi:hypothetical protein